MKNRVADSSFLEEESWIDATADLVPSLQKECAARVKDAISFVREHPAAGLATAACLGLAVGWLLKRR